MFGWLRKTRGKLDLNDSLPVESRAQAFEYQQVAGVLCLDIDVLRDIVTNNENMTKEEVIEQIQLLVDNKNELINNKEVRESRWAAAHLLFNLPRGSIVAGPYR